MINLSPYVMVVVASLVISQLLKYLLLLGRRRTFDPVRQIYASGSMPSTHGTAVVSMLTVVGLKEGTDSGLFGLMLLIAVIVMYDTVMLRRSVGDQGRAMQELIQSIKSAVALPHSAKGHTPVELLIGALLGFLIGIVVFIATT